MKSGFCGWLGETPLSSAAPRLTRMAEAFSGGASSREVDAAGAVAAAGRSKLHREGRLVVSWLGSLDGPSVLRSFREHGVPALTRLAGQASLTVLDLEDRELLLAVDRFGIQTLYYRRGPSGVAFATTLSSLVADPEVQSDVDVQSVFNYVYFHTVPGPRGIFRGVERLEPGEYLRAAAGRVETGRYWTPSYRERADASEPELIGEFRSSVRSAVRSCLDRAEGKVGAFLSGGTDSSTVTGVLGELTGEPPNTYSIGFQVQGYDETSYAHIAAEHFHANHHEYVVTPEDLVDALPRLAGAYDEPFGNASAIASYYCARLAKQDGVHTMLGGDGGDEIFAGNERYLKQRVFERYALLPAPLRHHLVEPILERSGDHAPSLLRKARSYVQQANVPLPDRLGSYNFLNRTAPREIFTDDFLSAVRVEEPLELLRKTYAAAPTSSVVNRLLYLDIKFTLADNDLRKVGGTCALAGVDVDYPFLDPDLVDFANRIPPALKLRNGQLRYFFKKASRGFLPDEILAKQKHGFGVPCGRWIRDHVPLRELAYESLHSLARRGYLKKTYADRLIELHQGDHVDYYGVMIWVLLMLELWHQNHAPGKK
jgi:asparagine synthase (glutamine-hydrolysing)